MLILLTLLLLATPCTAQKTSEDLPSNPFKIQEPTSEDEYKAWLAERGLPESSLADRMGRFQTQAQLAIGELVRHCQLDSDVPEEEALRLLCSQIGSYLYLGEVEFPGLPSYPPRPALPSRAALQQKISFLTNTTKTGVPYALAKISNLYRQASDLFLHYVVIPILWLALSLMTCLIGCMIIDRIFNERGFLSRALLRRRKQRRRPRKP